MKFLNLHNGLRPGEFSVLVGQKGNGKSAMLKTFAVHAACGGIKVLHVLSEERSELYKYNQSRFINYIAPKDPSYFLKNLYYDSMLDWPDKLQNVNAFFERLENHVNEFETDLVIFDNFTTAFFDELPIGQQGDAIRRFRAFAKHYDLSVVAAFHTIKGTDFYSKLLTGEDVKGSSTSTNSGSYNYILSTYFFEKPLAVMFIDKARYHTRANKTYWILKYNEEFGLYDGDQLISRPKLEERLLDEKLKMAPSRRRR